MANAISYGSVLMPMLNNSTAICVSASDSSHNLDNDDAPMLLKSWTFTKPILSAIGCFYEGEYVIPFTTTAESSMYFLFAVNATTLSGRITGSLSLDDSKVVALIYNGNTLSWMITHTASGIKSFKSSCIIAWVTFSE